MMLILFKIVNENFRIKIFVTFVLLIFFISSSFTFFLLHCQSQSLTDTLVKNGNLLAEVLAFNSRIGVFSESNDLLEVAADGILREEEILRVSIFNLEGKLLKSKEKPEIRTLGESVEGDEASRRKIIKTMIKTVSPFYHIGDNTAEFWAPVISTSDFYREPSLSFKDDSPRGKTQVIGFTMITVDKRTLHKALNDLLFKTIFMEITFLLIGSVIAYFVVRGITKPLNRLIESVKTFGTAGMVAQVAVETEDEIGNLARAFNNMTESLKKREGALRDSEEKYRSLAASVDSMYSVDEGCTYLFMNEEYRMRFGLPLAEIIGRRYGEFHEEEDTKEFADCIREVCETGKPFIKEHESERDGRHYLRTFTPIISRSPIGETCEVVIVAKDITKHKQAENELRKALHNLQETKEQLIQAEKLTALGQLSAGVAHEILNPINIVSMRLQLMELTDALSEKAKEGVQICKDQVARIVKITRDIKGFARNSATYYSKSDVNQLIDHAIALVAPRLNIENVKIVIQHEPELPHIEIDKDRVEQVILNLINNAVDAMRSEKEKILRISTKLKEQHVVIVVSDTGIGIAPEILNRIFDPFFTTKEQGQGTGLGLSISYGIVHDHGGTIWAENNERGGASLFIKLPIHYAEGISDRR